MEEEIVNQVAPSGSSGGNSGGSLIGNLFGSVLDYFFGELAADNQLERQKELTNDQRKYNLPSAQMERMIAAGLTPAAAAQSVAGQQNVQSASTISPRPVFDSMSRLGDSLMDSKLKTSEILGNNANTANTIAFGLHIDPLYKAKIASYVSSTLDNLSKVGLNRQLAYYYKQSAEQIKEQRPWQLETTIQGLKNLIAMTEERIANKAKIEQDTKTSAAQEDLYKQETNTQKSLEGLYTEQEETERHKQRELDSETERNYSEAFNNNQIGFALMFDNGLRAMGWNPNSSASENLKRLAFTDPRGFLRVTNNLVDTVQKVDSVLQEQFGKEYKKKVKRLAAAGFVHYAGNKFIDTQLRRFGSFTGSIGNLIPLAHPSQPARVKGFSLY